MNQSEFIEHLKQFIESNGTQKQAAEVLEISTSYLNDILHGRREPGRKSVEAFGMRKVISYVQEEEGTEWLYL